MRMVFLCIQTGVLIIILCLLAGILERIANLETIAVATVLCQSDGTQCVLKSIDTGFSTELIFVANGEERLFYCTRLLPFGDPGCSGPHGD